MDKLFCYGTLCSSPVIRALIGRLPDSESALLPGYSAYTVNGANYPAVVPQRYAETAGLIYYGLTPGELKKLDAYEGGEYFRQRQTVVLSSGQYKSPAWVYVLKPVYRQRLSGKVWTYPQIIKSDAETQRHGGTKYSNH